MHKSHLQPDHLQSANQAYALAQWQEAKGLIYALIKQAASQQANQKLLHRLAICHSHLGEYLAAKSLYLYLLYLEPNQLTYRIELAQIDANCCNYLQAIIHLHPYQRHSNCAYALGCIYFTMHEYELAQQVFLHLVSQEPEHGEAWFKLSVIARAMGQLASAIEHLRKAIRYNPHQQEYYLQMARLLRLRNCPTLYVESFYLHAMQGQYQQQAGQELAEYYTHDLNWDDHKDKYPKPASWQQTAYNGFSQEKQLFI